MAQKKEPFYNERLFSVLLPYLAGKRVASNNIYFPESTFVERPVGGYDVFVVVPSVIHNKASRYFSFSDTMSLFTQLYRLRTPYAILLCTTYLPSIAHFIDWRLRPFLLLFNSPIDVGLSQKSFLWYMYSVVKSGYSVLDWRNL